jgi:hypothetical protein
MSVMGFTVSTSTQEKHMTFTIQNNINGNWESVAQTIGYGMAVDYIRMVLNTYDNTQYRVINQDNAVVYPKQKGTQ